MYTYPIHSRDPGTAAKTLTAPMAIPVGSRCVKGVRPPAAPHASIEALMFTEMIVNAFNANASQLYRGI